MADPIEEVLAPSVIERTMTIFESFKGARSLRDCAGAKGAYRACLRVDCIGRDRREAASGRRTDIPEIVRRSSAKG